jgi:hypothetical protein
MIAHLDDKLRAHAGRVAREMTRRARHGLFDGRSSPEAQKYIIHCTADDEVTDTRIIFTRDSGHHTSGWMRNPDYERCRHLSLSPRPDPRLCDPTGQRSRIFVSSEQLTGFDAKTWRVWVDAFFGEDVRYVWHESPKSSLGKRLGVQHWRLFCNVYWEPIVPRGEVYSSELTELGWRSASQVLEEEGRIIQSTVDPT